MKTKLRLTISLLNKMANKEEIWDTDVPGLHIRNLKSGKFFYLYYRNKYGEQRKPSLGRYGAVSLNIARIKAREFLAEISKGGDPSVDKELERKKENPTIYDLFKRWEKEHSIQLKSKMDQIKYWETYIIPFIGKMKVRDLNKKDIIWLLSKINSNYTHNRIRSILSKALNLAEDWSWREDFTNPVRKIKKRQEFQRRRYLKPFETKRLGAVLRKWRKSEKPCESQFACLIYLLMFTGARRNEIMKAKWEYIDWNRGVLDLPDSKSGAKEIVLPCIAIELLKNMFLSKSNDWIIPGRHGNNPMVGSSHIWKRMREEAQIDNLRIHDLRHSFASTALSSAGGTLPQVGELLGHSRPDTTSRYAHFMTAPKLELANRTAEVLNEWLS